MERKEPTLTGATPLSDPTDSVLRAEAVALPQKSGPSFVAVIALLIALASLGGSGFLAWQLTESQKALQLAKGRITGLETRLNLSSDQSTQTVEDIDAKLKWADSEIRKLWGVSNDTNKKKIAANVSGIAALKKSLATTKRNTTKSRASVTAMGAKITTLQANLDKSDGAITQLEIQALTVAQMKEDVERIIQQMPGLRGLATRVKTNEEAIAAIDAYRRNLNRDLLQLKKQISNSATP